MAIKKSKHIWLIAGLIILSLHLSCNFLKEKSDHPQLLQPIISRANKLSKTNPEKSFALVDSVFQHIATPGPGDAYARYDFKRRYFMRGKNYPYALMYADSMLLALKPYAADKDYNLRYAEVYLYMGDALFEQKRFNDAYQEFYQGKIAMKPANDSMNGRFQFEFNKRLADICYGQGRYVESAEWNKKAIAPLKYCHAYSNQDYMVQGILDNIALSYTKAKMADSAMYYCNLGLQQIANAHPKDSMQKVNLDIGKGVILGNQGTVFVQIGDIATAEQKFIQSIAINGQQGYANEDAMITRMKLAELYVQSKQLEKAGKLVHDIETWHDTLTGSLDKQQLRMLQASYARAIGQLADANALLYDYIAEQKSYKEDNKVLMATDFNKEFELQRRQYDLNNLKEENKLKNFYLLATIILCLMAIAIIYLILKSNRQARTYIKHSALHTKQLELTLGALEKSTQENIQVLSVVAHDLKNPISAIYGISLLMADDEGRNEQDQEMLDIIKISSNNMNRLIHDLLSARINKQADDDSKTAIDLGALLGESIALLQYRAKDKKQRIVLLENELCMVTANRDRVWRVINNLLVNAIKFSPKHTLIQVSWRTAGNEAITCIKDQGIGIPPEMQAKIFQLFTDAKRQGTSGEETYGLGLYISRQIVEEQGGKMWFESVAGKGTSFYFSLPLAPHTES